MNREDLKQLREYAGYIALVGLVVMAASGVMYYFNRVVHNDRLELYWQISLGVGGVLVALAILLRPDAVRSWLTGRQAKYGSNALVTVVALLGILVIANLLGYRHYKRYDVTENKKYTLSSQTISILSSLEEPIEMVGFFTVDGGRQQQSFEELLAEYKAHTDKITYRNIDPEVNPGEARQYKPVPYNGVLLIMGDRRQELYAYNIDEQAITSAILKVNSDATKTVYFITGHGEHDPESFQNDGLGTLKDLLANDNFEVLKLNLSVITDTIPADASAIVIAGPTTPYTEQELDLLGSYLDAGGKALIMVGYSEDGGNPLGDLLEPWGIKLRDDLVLDLQNAFMGQDPATPVVLNYGYTEITRDMSGVQTFYPLSRSLDIADPSPDGMGIARLATTSEASWSETDMESVAAGNAKYDEGVDTQGPVVIAASVEYQTTGTRIVVVGNSYFATNEILNAFQGIVGNDLLAMNSINWLAEEEELIGIRPKQDTSDSMVLLTPLQTVVTLFTTIILIPLFVVVSGTIIWWQRR